MKTSILVSLLLVGLMMPTRAQSVLSACLTMEQTQAKYNQDKANSIIVVNTATQQQQCYYQQLATYYQQLDKDNQQKAKDAQQIAKDQQQLAADAALKLREKALADTVASCTTEDLNPWVSDGCGGYKKTLCGELWTCVNGNTMVDGIPLEAYLRIKGVCAALCQQEHETFKKEYKINHSGGGDGTNPGGGGNSNGFFNPNKSGK